MKLDEYSDDFLIEILTSVKTIALVGASSKPERDSFKVMKVLLDSGYKVFPVNPNEKDNIILGQSCHADLNSIDESIDMVDVFRAEEAIIGIAKESIQIKAKVLWTQLGIVNEEASKLAKKAGLKVVMNRCPKIELDKLDSKK